MKRPSFLVVTCLTLGLSAVAISGGGRNPILLAGNVLLQDTTPGTAQIGHANIKGTFRAGQVNVTSTVAATTPVIGNNNSTDPNAIGGSFSTFSQTGIGLRATATNTGGSAKAIYGESRGSSGIGIDARSTGRYGVAIHALADGFDGGGIKGEGLSGNGYGVFGNSNWVGVWAIGKNHGLHAIGHPNDPGNILHAAVYGEGINDNVGPSYGVYGTADNNGAGTCYGISGSASGGGTNWAIYGYGNTGATGTKSFEIDHPLAPETMTLRQYCAEGAEPLLVYSGNIKLDAKGSATVRVADYVGEIGRDWRYQLTPVGASMPNLFVAKTFSTGTFSIAGGVANASVSWSLTGVRNDRWVRKNGAPVEVPKPAEMRGRYLEPSLYGKDESAGVRSLQTRATQ